MLEHHLKLWTETLNWCEEMVQRCSPAFARGQGWMMWLTWSWQHGRRQEVQESPILLGTNSDIQKNILLLKKDLINKQRVLFYSVLGLSAHGWPSSNCYVWKVISIPGFVWDDSSGRTTRKMSGNKDQITQSSGDIMDTVHKFLVVFWEDNHTKRRMTIMTTTRKI